MHPAIPLAHQFLSAHTQTISNLLEQGQELSHARRLAKMLQTLITETTASVTVKQVEAIVELTKLAHGDLSRNLMHYQEEQTKYSAKFLDTEDNTRRLELTRHIRRIDVQMKTVRADMERLHRFSTQLIFVCGEAGLTFVRDLAIPSTREIKGR